MAAGPFPAPGKVQVPLRRARPSRGPQLSPGPPPSREAPPPAGSLRTEAVCPWRGSQGCLPQSRLSSEPALPPWSEEAGRPRVRRRLEEHRVRASWARSSERTPGDTGCILPMSGRPSGEDETWSAGAWCPTARPGAEAAWTWARPGAGPEEGGGGAQRGLAERPRPAAPPPLVPLNSWAAVSALPAPSAWGHCLLGCHRGGLPGCCPRGQEASSRAGGWPPSVLWLEELRAQSPRPPPRPHGGGCCSRPVPGQGVWTRRPGPRCCGPASREAVPGLGLGGRARVSGRGGRPGAQTLSLSLLGHAPGGAARPRRPCGECPALFPVTCGGSSGVQGGPLLLLDGNQGWTPWGGHSPGSLRPPPPSPGRRHHPVAAPLTA